ncbi:MAG: hypothetical protein PHW14_04955 [Candidatus Omnitrophica bacterium]|jgi:hypothetical protein|nr:hypothetical protein [Candidatus Omnitrophota bacterium]
MSDIKTKGIKDLERRMEGVEEDSLRHHVMKSARDFKTSWIELGRILFTVWKDKLYKEWGYSEFEAYAAKEVGVRKETALKLLRSYTFLEKEAPAMVSPEYRDKAQAAITPTYEAVDVLRSASSNGKLDRADYATIKKYVLEKGKDAKEVKKDLTQMIKRREESDPAEEREKRSLAIIRRFVGALKAIRTEMKTSGILPGHIMKDADALISKIEAELPES